jgi:hypothetical protein
MSASGKLHDDQGTPGIDNNPVSIQLPFTQDQKEHSYREKIKQHKSYLHGFDGWMYDRVQRENKLIQRRINSRVFLVIDIGKY